MGNKTFKSLLNLKVEQFKRSFSYYSPEFFKDLNVNIYHPGEYGSYRENVIKPFLKIIMPQKYSIGSGFLINNKEGRSSQIDIVIYDSKVTPLIEDQQNVFYPVETVVGIGEIKSTLSKKDFGEALRRLASNKELKSYSYSSPILEDQQRHFNINHPYDQLFSFLICEKLDFDYKNIDFNTIYESSLPSHARHNIILSVQDGLFLYKLKDDEKRYWPYPIGIKKELGIKNETLNHFVNKNDDDLENAHFEAFSVYFFQAISSKRVFFPEMATYLR